MSGYLPRLIDGELAELLPQVGAVALEGPKGVGKTATAARLARTVFRMDDQVQAERVVSRAATITEVPAPVLIDEWQRAPQSWDLVRRAVDDGGRRGRYLLTGSAFPLTTPVHSGAGRIIRLRMRPMCLLERGLETPTVSLERLLAGGVESVSGTSAMTIDDYAREILHSGFPGLRGGTWKAVRRELDSYLVNIAQRELRENSLVVKRPDAMMRWLRAYAAASGGTASYSAILDAATPGESNKPGKRAASAYREALTALWLLDDVGPWVPHGHGLPALGRTPKHFLADPALAARLMDLSETDLVASGGNMLGPQQGQVLGRLFEALVALSLQVMAEVGDFHLSHLRDARGRHEIDFVITRGRLAAAIEVKLGAKVLPSTVDHMNWAERTFAGDRLTKVVVNASPEAYTRDDGIHVVPAALLGP